MNRMSGPRKIIDLDLTPESEWEVDDKALHLYLSQLWSHVTTGCVLCVESDRTDAKGQTLRSVENETSLCLTHGELDEVPYTITRDYLVKFGNVERRGRQEYSDMVLIPKSMPELDRINLIERLLEVAAEEESKQNLLDDE